MNSDQLTNSGVMSNGKPTRVDAAEERLGERTLHFVAQSCSVPQQTEAVIGDCTVTTRSLQIADAITTYRKLAPKSTI